MFDSFILQLINKVIPKVPGIGFLNQHLSSRPVSHISKINQHIDSDSTTHTYAQLLTFTIELKLNIYSREFGDS